MKGFYLNNDLTYTTKMVERIINKEGHCPCRIGKDETTLCPCDAFINTHECKCNLFIKKENEQ